MALVTRRLGKRGYVRVDTFNTGPLTGQIIAYISNDPSRIILMDSPPSGTTQAFSAGDAIYDQWEALVDLAADWDLGPPINGARTRAVALACWLEFFLWPGILATDAELIANGFTAAQRRRALAASLFTFRVPNPYATDIATAWVDSSIKPAFGDLGLGEPPPWVQDMSQMFDVADDDAI
jgi:hypothetical protein